MASPAQDNRLSADPACRAGLSARLDSRLMTKVLAGLFAAGGTLALLTVALPHSRRANALALLLLVGAAYVTAGALLWRAGDLPRKVLTLAVALGTLLITAVAYFSGESPSPLVLLYLWIFLYSACFLTTREMVGEIVCAGLAYALLLIARPPPAGIAEWWLVGMGALAVAAAVIAAMRERVEQLIRALYDAARTDPLTQLSNRRGFRELLDLELDRARRGETDMAVMIADLDHFGEVTDRSGQQVADAALQRVARLLQRGKRTMDGVARVGGEEFALVLPNTDEHSAFLIAERLRGELRDEFARDAVPVTISFGVACYPLHGETAYALLRAADEALYAARGSGGDRTVLHSQALKNASHAGEGSRDIAGERFLAVALDLAESLDLRFCGSARHSETVGRYAEMMARELGLSEQRIARVRLAGLLHDVGAVGVPDSVLKKPDKLTGEELGLIRRHPALGAQILDHPSLADVREWVGAHHERPDGRGYPLGLTGESIPLEARIVAVADAYEAMTSERSYRRSMRHTEACAELQRCAGSQFDARVVAALIALLGREAERAETALGLL